MKRLPQLFPALLLFVALTPVLAQQRGGELTFGRYADSLFLDPVLNDANLDIWVLTNLYDTLLQPTEDGTGVTPGLAESYEVSDDGLTFTLTLRDGVKFADGSDITAEDVKWSLDRARNPENGIWSFTLESVEEIAAEGDQVTITLSRPDPVLPAALAMFNSAIMPKDLFEAQPGETDLEKAQAFAENPVGSGPFMLSEWERGSYMVLERNPYYWETGEDGEALPYLDRVRFEIIPDDNTRILRLQSGEIDAAEFIPLSRVQELEADSPHRHGALPQHPRQQRAHEQPRDPERRHAQPALRRARPRGHQLRHQQRGARPGGRLRQCDADGIVHVHQDAFL